MYIPDGNTQLLSSCGKGLN